MKTSLNKTQTILVTVTALAFLSAGYLFFANNSLKKQLHREKINSESLLSEKLELEKNLDKFQKDLTALKGKNTKLDKLVAETNAKLDKKEAEIRRLLSANASIGDLKKKNAELLEIRKNLENELAGLNINLNELMAENAKQKELLASLGTKNDQLAQRNLYLESILADNYQVEALRGKHDKLTVMARRTNKLLVSFDLPADVKQELNYRLVTPENLTLSSKDEMSMNVKCYDNESNLLANNSVSGTGSVKPKRAELIYKPEKKLTKGVYKFLVYDGEEYISTLQLKLK